MSRQTQQRTKARIAELAGQTFTLQVVPERAPDVSRTIELRASDTLSDLHDAIQEAFLLDDEHPYSFFLSGRAWDPHSAFDGPGKAAGRTTLHAAGLKAGASFLYVFDYGDELRHQITVEATGTAEPGVSYPRTLSGVGEPPPQYGDMEEWEVPEVEADLAELGAEVAASAREAEERMQSERQGPLTRETLLAELALAQRLQAALAGRAEQLEAIDAEHDVDLSEWLSDLTFALAEHGLVDEALEMHGAWAERMDAEDFVGDRALLLARAGRKDEALEEARRCAAAAPDDPDALDRAAEIFHRCGDLAAAERLSRQVLELADDPLLRGAAADRLVEVLQQTGRGDEAADMARLHEDILDAAGAYGDDGEDDLWSDDDEAPEDEGAAPTLLRALAAASPTTTPPPWAPLTAATGAQKVGANALCPCGSGKKYKLCCRP